MAKNKEPFWKPGERLRLAAQVGIDRSNLCKVLNRQRGVRPVLALKLEAASGIPFSDWMLNRTTTHPAFFGKPKKS